MILFNLAGSWPRVQAGEVSAREVTLSAWAGISDEALEKYGDVVLGIYKNEVVSAFDVEAWWRHEDGDLAGRVVFEAHESQAWAHLVGTENPTEPWRRGQARPVKYLDTRQLIDGDVEVEESRDGHRAVVGHWVLTVDGVGNATVQSPPGGVLKVIRHA